MDKQTGNTIQYRFTKYVETALIRTKRDFLQKEGKRTRMEEFIVLEYLESESDEMDMALNLSYMEEALNILWEPEAVRSFLVNQTDKRMQEVLLDLNDEEVLVVFAKVFRQLTFAEIGDIMGMKEKRIAYVYSYARTKMKRGWRNKNGV